MRNVQTTKPFPFRDDRRDQRAFSLHPSERANGQAVDRRHSAVAPLPPSVSTIDTAPRTRSTLHVSSEDGTCQRPPRRATLTTHYKYQATASTSQPCWWRPGKHITTTAKDAYVTLEGAQSIQSKGNKTSNVDNTLQVSSDSRHEPT
jgi:hypothetical protein